MTAKTWYWAGLGILIVSIVSSGTGRCWQETVSGMFDQIQAKTLPYLAMAEMAMGQPETGLGHMQAAQARMEAEAVRLQAAQARIQADRARLEALAATHYLNHRNVLARYPGVASFDIEVPGVSVTQDRVVVRAQHGLVVCPRSEVTMPVLPTPRVPVMQKPI